MTELRIGDQLIRFDRDATVTAYSELTQGGADVCTCSGCRNFARVRDKAYPSAFRAFLDALGIDPNKEGETVYYGPKAGLHFYGPWFYFAGELVEAGGRSVRIGDEFEYWIGSGFSRPPAAFGQRTAVVECATVVPWVLEEPYDTGADSQMIKAEEIMHRYRNALRALANSDR